MTNPKQNPKAVHRLAHWTGLSYTQCNSLIYHMTSDSPSNGSTYGEKVVDHIFETAAKENPELFCHLFKSPTTAEPPKTVTEGIMRDYRKHIESLMMTTKADTEVLPKGITKDTKYKTRDRSFEKLSDAVLFNDIMGKLEGNSKVMRSVCLEFEKRFWPNRRGCI